MPARDECQPQVISALKKVGWHVSKEQVGIRFGQSRRRLFADLEIEHQSEDQVLTILIVEVKCFHNNEFADLYEAIGQYVLYQHAMMIEKMDYPLYLSVPSPIFGNIFQSSVVQSVINFAKINLVVVDLIKEEVTQWINLSKS